MRDRPVPEGGRGVRGDEAERRDPLRRAGLGDRSDVAARAAGDLRCRRAGARHLLRRAGDGGSSSAARSRAGITASSAAPRSRCVKDAALFEGVWQQGGKYPVWMSHGDRVTRAAAGLRGDRRLEQRAVRRHRGREAQVLRGAIPSRGGAHAGAARSCCAISCARFPAQRRLDHARLQGRGDRPHPRTGRQGQGDLRPLRRRRLCGRGGADPRGDRRAVDLRVRRSRPVAPRRRAEGRAPVPRQLQHPARARARPRSCFSTRSRARPTRR